GERRRSFPELDTDIAAVVTRCLESDPAKRPHAARAVATALPVTPEVAPASTESAAWTDAITHVRPTGTLRPAVAWMMLAAAIGGTLTIASRAHILTVAPGDIPKPPEVLADRSRALLASVGNVDIPADSEFRFATTRSLGDTRSITIRFAYRQSPRYLVPGNLFHLVTEEDP